MDPHEFAQQHGQVIGSRPDQAADPVDDEDLMGLLLDVFVGEDQLKDASDNEVNLVVRFAEFCNEYLAKHRVVSTGVVNGEFSLVFQDGFAVPLTSAGPVVERPGSTFPITRPKDSKMKGMNVVDTSVPVTTGTVGSPTRQAK